ncbi:zinc finger BED domain-containing protein RICESLEEPER 2-like [Beta vulgaris subsp. vulgaris]|uniref:zinc finger BED domain-containing protein RICESLEEPER 2-like n=1 Tax=Beta vulgaris subsp. vulgaris TaxID=3555 RepID=UPI0025485871|nr:zinc finger BED domain-containing protein RICESLEEPER 2-like [Beta vulgaris subsp. vulgaris]
MARKKEENKDRSEVWEHFLKKETPLGLRAICKYCRMEYKCNPKKNDTSVLWGHINRCRKYPYNTPKDSKQSILSFRGAKIGDGTSNLTYQKYDPASIRKALSFMVIVDELPFKFVEGVGFRHFCNVMEPRFHVPSRITVAKDCYQTYLIEKRKLKNVLKHYNASSNDTAIGYLRRKINHWKSGVLKGRYLHMRCVANIINLVVSDGLKTMNESVNRVRHAVRFIKQSPARLLRFKKCVLEEKINTKNLLCLDVPTRWNSTYLMLSAAIDLEGAFERYGEEDPHYVIELNEREGKGTPTYDDWSNVKRFSEFLQAFYDLTLRVSGSLYVTSNLFFHELVNVALLLKELESSEDFEMCVIASKMKEKYDKYWGDVEKMNMLIFIAVVLDPRYKLDYVEWMITQIYRVDVASTLITNLREALNAMYEEYRGFSSSDVLKEESKYKKHKFEKEGDAKIELDKYLDEDTEDEDEFDILGWWKFNSARFPTMGSMARDVLAVPISTVASKSAFSTGGRFLDSFRSSLTPRVVEGLVCAQNWLHASPFPSIEECLEEVEQLEEDLENMTLGDDNDEVFGRADLG